MTQLGEWISAQTQEGEATVVENHTVKPQSWALKVHFPFGGFVWHRPVAVKVENDGTEERMAIVDVTLYAQVALLAMTALFSGLSILHMLSRR